jgi:hypothetical protein
VSKHAVILGSAPFASSPPPCMPDEIIVATGGNYTCIIIVEPKTLPLSKTLFWTQSLTTVIATIQSHRRCQDSLADTANIVNKHHNTHTPQELEKQIIATMLSSYLTSPNNIKECHCSFICGLDIPATEAWRVALLESVTAHTSLQLSLKNRDIFYQA